MKNYIKQTKNLSLSSRNLHSFTTSVQTSSALVLEPWFIVGFVDGEGS